MGGSGGGDGRGGVPFFTVGTVMGGGGHDREERGRPDVRKASVCVGWVIGDMVSL